MVFPGRFSTGCMRCRQRKVKVSIPESGEARTLHLHLHSRADRRIL